MTRLVVLLYNPDGQGCAVTYVQLNKKNIHERVVLKGVLLDETTCLYMA